MIKLPLQGSPFSASKHTVLFFIAILAFSLIACEGKAGPIGPAGPQGETGPPKEGVIIERQLSSYLYDEDGTISIEDDRITPTTFQTIYLKIASLPPNLNKAVYAPLDYLLVSALADELETPSFTILITEGMLLIADPNRDLLAAALGAFSGGIDVNLAILVSQ